MKQVSIESIAIAVSGSIINKHLIKANIVYNNVSIDSRTIGDNDIFIPIKGDNFDGHNFISMAYEKGAIISFTQYENKIPSDKIGILVNDTGQAMKGFAKYYRSLFNIPVVAITGSVGKTSCKDMIASILSAKYRVHKTSGNYNNEIGVPLTIFKLEETHEVLVLEMGMNHYGELHRLSEMATPDIAVITNIGEAHIEYFGSKDGILKAKSEILDFLKEDGLVILNGDDEYLDKLNNKLEFKTRTFGFQYINDLYVSEYNILGWEGIDALVKSNLEQYNIHLDTLGKHMLYNVMPAIIIGKHLNMTISEIEEGASRYKATKMRMDKMIFDNNVVVINDAYNASTDSMKSSLETLSNLETEGRKIAILGDMFEMGDYSEVAHRKVGEIASSNEFNLLICVGAHAKHIYDSAIEHGVNKTKVQYYKTKEELIDKIHLIINQEDTIIVKASRGMFLEKVIDKIKEYAMNIDK
jgi:UDP-N-acetylmuramoyl-tripeptide--D-alanyl-D-alanine ligase